MDITQINEALKSFISEQYVSRQELQKVDAYDYISNIIKYDGDDAYIDGEDFRNLIADYEDDGDLDAIEFIKEGLGSYFDDLMNKTLGWLGIENEE